MHNGVNCLGIGFNLDGSAPIKVPIRNVVRVDIDSFSDFINLSTRKARFPELSLSKGSSNEQAALGPNQFDNDSKHLKKL